MQCAHKKTQSVSTGDTLTYSCRDCGAVLNVIDTSVKQKITPKPLLLPLKKVEEAKMKNGEIRKLPAANSTMWTTQYSVQGSAAKPYVVTYRSKAAGIPVDSWACSCPNWTRTSPRVECKHILNVILKEKMAMPVSQAMDEKTAKEFAAFQKAKAKKELGIKEDWGISTGRKFR
jgi:hypothetical protein